jgi:hypothetical protein
MKNISNLTQPEVDPFDAPVPGQSLTDEPGNYPWEHPPQYSDPEEVLDLLFDKLGEPEVVEQVIAMLDSGVPVEAIVELKAAREKIDDISQDITEDTPTSKPEGGLLSRPTTEEE